MATILDIKKIMDKWAPPDTAEEWDNVGLQIGDPYLELTEIIIALEVDEAVLAYLEDKQSCCVITHHPLFFKALRQIRYDQDLGHIIQVFSKGNHHLFSAHTNLDYAKDGVNDCLIEKYGLLPKQGQPLLHGFGKFFDMPAVSYETLCAVLPCEKKGAVAVDPVNRLAFCAGSGHGFIKRVIDLRVDTFITGEITYHDHVTCRMNGVRVLVLGHKESENFICNRIHDVLVKQKIELPMIVLD
ncbi:Nif3-like dinuclear metal center hexameric protein [bacterium]|nr:Nif3-like dinuclear metal center hexameric protein [Actinomycetota bacterium]MBE33413.1 Nif3-like dinuclear metal center hexameric protein [bacterium]|tara:strand:+ start:2259 stop:2984 length:726 start_codon:yes stop_codon:yes gene_type:complete